MRKSKVAILLEALHQVIMKVVMAVILRVIVRTIRTMPIRVQYHFRGECLYYYELRLQLSKCLIVGIFGSVGNMINIYNVCI